MLYLVDIHFSRLYMLMGYSSRCAPGRSACCQTSAEHTV